MQLIRKVGDVADSRLGLTTGRLAGLASVIVVAALSSGCSKSSDNGGGGGPTLNCAGGQVVSGTNGGCVGITNQAPAVLESAMAVTPTNLPPTSVTINGKETAVTYPEGFYTYTLTDLPLGGTTQVTLSTPPGTNPIGYLKCDSAFIQCLPYDNAVVAGNVITLQLTDGGDGDGDNKANTVIIDPGSPIFAQSTNQPQPLQEAKALVNSLRTTIQSVQSLKNPATAFTNGVQASAVVTNQAMSDLFRALHDAVFGAGELYTSGNGASATTTITTQNGAGANETAQLTITNTTGANPVSTVSVIGNVDNDTVNITVSFPQNPHASTLSTITGTFVGNNNSIATTGTGPGAKFIISGGTLTVDKSNSAPIADKEINVTKISVSGAAATLEQQNLAAGQIPLTFIGTVSGDAVACTAAGCVADVNAGKGQRFVPADFSFSGKFTQGTAEVDASLTASLNNAAAFDPKEKISAGNAPSGTAELQVSALSIPNIPTTSVDIKLTLNSFYDAISTDDHAPIGNTTVTLTQSGAELLQVSATSSPPPSGNGTADLTLNISDTQGDLLEVQNPFSGSISGDIGQGLVNGTVVATISKTSNGLILIQFSDGTFETLTN